MSVCGSSLRRPVASMANAAFRSSVIEPRVSARSPTFRTRLRRRLIASTVSIASATCRSRITRRATVAIPLGVRIEASALTYRPRIRRGSVPMISAACLRISTISRLAASYPAREPLA